MRKHIKQTIRATLILGAFCAVTSAITSANAQTSERTYSFPGTVSAGIFPSAGLAADAKGNFYGVTEYGGRTGGPGVSVGNGTVFKIDKTGKASVLYAFTAANGDGSYPQGGLVIDASGNLYGTTSRAGDNLSSAGTVFEIEPNGTEIGLHVFTPFEGVDGAYPTSTLTLDRSTGILYGTTSGGGNNNAGTVFTINAKGVYRLLYSFTGGTDGASPNRAPMILDSEGNLYGVTVSGGALNFGVMYELNSAGQESVLYAFTGGNDGGNPLGALARDTAGNLYGVTNVGGANGNGVVYKLSNGQQTVIHSFGSGLDGQPFAGVIMDAAGNIFGTTTLGGAYQRGSIFKIDSSGNFTTFYSFNGGPGGGRPFGELIEDASGNLFSTTIDGGSAQAGTAFELLP